MPDSVQALPEANRRDWVEVDPLVTFIRSRALVMDLPPNAVRSNFMYAAVTGWPSEMRVVAAPKLVAGEPACIVASAIGVRKDLVGVTTGGGDGVAVGEGVVGGVVLGPGLGVAAPETIDTLSTQTNPVAAATLKCSEASESETDAE